MVMSPIYWIGAIAVLAMLAAPAFAKPPTQGTSTMCSTITVKATCANATRCRWILGGHRQGKCVGKGK